MDAHLTPDELRELFLFADLTPEQLDWVAGCGDVVEVAAGANVVTEGELARCFYVLLSGTVAMSRMIGGETVETTRTDHRGVLLRGRAVLPRRTSPRGSTPRPVRAITDCDGVGVARQGLRQEVRAVVPDGPCTCWRACCSGMRRGNQQLAERERLLALGKLSAGLTHELNNPAAAAIRATDALRDKVTGMRNKLAMIADGRIAGPALRKLVMAQDEFVKKVRHAPTLSPLEASDREDELGDWFDDHGIDGGWDLAPVFVAGGLGVEDMEAVATACENGHGGGPDPLARLHGREREPDAGDHRRHHAHLRSRRRGEAVLAARPRAVPVRRRPRGPRRHAGDVRAQAGGGVGVKIVKDYDRSLPQIPAYPAELNQVWTNIIDNALDAMDCKGTLTVRTARVDDRALVEIGDTGPGIPPDIRRRIFEPFFTTKGVGKGTGLGLDVSYRVIVTRHHGDVQVQSEPGDTRFRVFLPLTEPEA